MTVHTRRLNVREYELFARLLQENRFSGSEQQRRHAGHYGLRRLGSGRYKRDFVRAYCARRAYTYAQHAAAPSATVAVAVYRGRG